MISISVSFTQTTDISDSLDVEESRRVRKVSRLLDRRLEGLSRWFHLGGSGRCEVDLTILLF